jgi:gluconolactonase
MDFEIVAEGLAFPEGPIAMDDGSVIVVEIRGGCITRCWGDGRTEVIATTGGGPNGAAIGKDGAIYVCNLGEVDRTRGVHLSGPGECGRIERIDVATGKVERLYTECDGKDLGSPNDLVVDEAGGIWFTDIGRNYEDCWTRSALYYCTPDGSSIRKVFSKAVGGWGFGADSYNGVGLSPDQKTVYVADMRPARVTAFALDGFGELAPGSGPNGSPDVIVANVRAGNNLLALDSLAVTKSGKICVGTIFTGGIAVVDPATGESEHVAFPDQMTTNICFGGEDMRTAYITQSRGGKLIKTRWPEPGLKLNY